MILEILVGAANWSPPRRSLDAETVLFGSGKLPERLPDSTLTDVLEGPPFVDDPWEVPMDLAVASEEADRFHASRRHVHRLGVITRDRRVRTTFWSDDALHHMPERCFLAFADRSRLGAIDAFAGLGPRGRGATQEGGNEDARKGGNEGFSHVGLLWLWGDQAPFQCALRTIRKKERL